MYGAYAQIGRNVMLRHPPDDMRAVGKQALITLFRRIADEGNELVVETFMPGSENVQDDPDKAGLVRQLFDELEHIYPR